MKKKYNGPKITLLCGDKETDVTQEILEGLVKYDSLEEDKKNDETGAELIKKALTEPIKKVMSKDKNS